MKNNKIYLVIIQSGGAWESYSYTEFATEDKDYAEKWVEKFNKLVDKWRNYFGDLIKNNEKFVMNSDWAYDRWEQFHDLDGAIITETELR